MKMTASLKKWLVENASVKSDADDDAFRKAAAKALAMGSLTAEKYLELTTEKEVKEANEFEKRFDALTSSVDKLVAVLAGGGSKAAAKDADSDDDADDSDDADDDSDEDTKATSKAKAKDGNAWYKKLTTGLRGDGNRDEIHVKGAWEQYETTKTAARFPTETKNGKKHPFAGQQIRDMGRSLDTPSDLDKAVSGAYAKFLISASQRGGSKTFGFQSLPQHDKELLYYAMEKMKWSGASDGGDHADIIERKLTPSEQKALIDDATSGGLEAAPIVFDDQVIQAPLQHGEFFPLVNVKPLDRGRRVEGVSTGKVTGAWGGVDDTAITLFTTTSYVSAFDTTIFRWEGAIKIGLDFLSDTPIDFGQHITEQYGERLLEDLDDVICVGNGTTQPEGVMNKSGTTSVAFGGATSLGNYESLRFGVTKKEHKGSMASTAVFGGTETSYMRARALPVGASDARRLGGMDYSSYSWMERPFKINESMTNAQLFYAILGRYRMYRRRGLTLRTSTEGDTLIRANEMLISCTARYGGQMERGACAAITTTAPA